MPTNEEYLVVLQDTVNSLESSINQQSRQDGWRVVTMTYNSTEDHYVVIMARERRA